MGSFAQSPEYIQLFFGGQTELAELIVEIGADDYTFPNKAVLIKVPDETMDSLIKDMAGELNLPDEAYEIAVTRMFLSIPNMVNSLQGANILAATGILNVSKAFQAHEDFTESTYVILIYDNHNSVSAIRRS